MMLGGIMPGYSGAELAYFLLNNSGENGDDRTAALELLKQEQQ